MWAFCRSVPPLLLVDSESEVYLVLILPSSIFALDENELLITDLCIAHGQEFTAWVAGFSD